MNNTLNLATGPCTIAFKARAVPEYFFKKLRPFVTKRSGDYTVALRLTRGSARTNGLVCDRINGDVVDFQREDFKVFIDRHKKDGCVSVARNYLSFNSCVRIAVSALLPFKRSLLLHASGLVLDGRAHVFVGRSGAGKSTIVKNTPRCDDLGDEIIGVQNKQGRWYAFSTPFGGELGTPGRDRTVPLGAIYLIRKSPYIRLKRVSPRQSIPVLLRCAINFSTDPVLTGKISSLVMDIASAVPVCELHTTIDSSFIKIYNEYVKNRRED